MKSFFEEAEYFVSQSFQEVSFAKLNFGGAIELIHAQFLLIIFRYYYLTKQTNKRVNPVAF